MISDFIKFKINDKEYIEVVLQCKLQDIYRFEEIEIIFNDKNKKYTLFEKDFIIEALSGFYDLLNKVLKNQLQMHNSIKQDIGYLWNEYLQNNNNHNSVKKINKEGRKYWVGEDYLLWSSLFDISTWLYNKNNLIYLEIAPVYKWHHSDPKEGEEFVAYDEWIKDYKPIAIIEIKKEIAEEWFKKTEEILEIIEEFDRKYLKKN